MRRRSYRVAAVALAALGTTAVVGPDAPRASDGVDPVQLAERMASAAGGTAADIHWVSTTRARAEHHLFHTVVSDPTNVLVIQFAADPCLGRATGRAGHHPRVRFGVLVVDARSGEVCSAGTAHEPFDLAALGPVQRAAGR